MLLKQLKLLLSWEHKLLCYQYVVCMRIILCFFALCVCVCVCVYACVYASVYVCVRGFSYQEKVVVSNRNLPYITVKFISIARQYCMYT